MGEFFRGWRRKFGFALLVLAFLLMLVWLRGLDKVDFIAYPTGEQSWHEWSISDGIIRFWMLDTNVAQYESVPASYRWTSWNIIAAHFINGDEQTYRWRTNQYQAKIGPIWSWQIPCQLFIRLWPIETLLIAVSAWLLFLKPDTRRRDLPLPDSPESTNPHPDSVQG